MGGSFHEQSGFIRNYRMGALVRSSHNQIFVAKCVRHVPIAWNCCYK